MSVKTRKVALRGENFSRRIKLFLPTYPEEILIELEKTPQIIFQRIQQANEILKYLRKERVKPVIVEVELENLFQGLKIIYHGSCEAIKDTYGWKYLPEEILIGVAAYEFLSAWQKPKENFKTWLKFSYKDYEYEKFLLTNNGDEILITEFLKKRLEGNRYLNTVRKNYR